jgi:transglutaminase-like putative cysteine protease
MRAKFLHHWRSRGGRVPTDLVYLFRRFVFAQVMLGIVCFCMASRNVGMLLMAGAIGGLSWYVTEGPKGRPLPRWIINLASVLIVAWLIFDLRWQQGHVVIAMGHFTIWLQILLLYTQKSNREYAQLLVLSLMLMIGASVLSVSVLYGMLLVAYCVLMLMTLLLFHFKSSSDLVLEANRAIAPPDARISRPKPIISRGYRWHFRIMALTAGVVCAGLAVTTFVVMPRSEPGKAMQRIADASDTPTQSGFRSEVDLSRSPASRTSHVAVMNVSVHARGRAVQQDGVGIRLRGAALDAYEPRTRRWFRSHQMTAFDQLVRIGPHGTTLAPLDANAQMMRADITLRGGGETVLFTALPVTHLASEHLREARFNPYDQQLSRAENNSTTIYSIRWPINKPADLVARYEKSLGRGIDRDFRSIEADFYGPDVPPIGPVEPDDDPSYAAGWPVQTSRVRDLARQVIAAHGLSRDEKALYDLRDAQIVQTLAHYLRTQYRYTLENPRLTGEDPTVAFLFDVRQGHCEVFASALAALTRSLGMRARVVTGYLASEYNAVGGYYVVRQSDAHAWCEIDLGPAGGWHTFDATPPDDLRAEHAPDRSWFTGIRQLYEHLEFAWIHSVVAYDQQTRDAVMAELNSSFSDAALENSWFGGLTEALRQLPRLWQIERFKLFLFGAIVFLLGLALASLVRLLVLRRRRLVALQLHSVPRSRRRGLSRKLRFYLKMLEMLDRHGYSRPDWQSPFSYAQELAEANPMRFDPVVALTEIFYEVRFGHRELDAGRRDRVKAHLRQLEHALSASG